MDLAGTRDIFAHSGTVPGNPGQLVTLALARLLRHCLHCSHLRRRAELCLLDVRSLWILNVSVEPSLLLKLLYFDALHGLGAP